MDKREYLKLKRLKKIDNIRSSNTKDTKIYCKYCGHTNLMPADKDFRICSWCGNRVINTTKAHFMKKMRELMEENK